MVRSCEAIGCNNNVRKPYCKVRNITFHRFPLKSKSILFRWLVRLRREDFNPTGESFLCSEHFTEDDFSYQPSTNHRRLKPNAVPSKKLFSEGKTKRRKRQSVQKNLGKYKPEDSVHKIETEVSPYDIYMSENSESDEEELSKEDCANLLELSMNEKFYMPNQYKELSRSLLNTPKKKSKEIVRAMKEKLAAHIVDRSLKKQMLEAGIKAAKLKHDYYEAKNAKLYLTCEDLISQRHLVSKEDLQDFTYLSLQLLEEEEAARIEERVLQEQLYDAEKKALDSRRNFYRRKRFLSLSNEDSQ